MQCVQEANKIPAGDTCCKALLVNNMLKKIEWIRLGQLFKADDLYLVTLPLPTRFLLPGVLGLFKDNVLGIKSVLAEVSKNISLN